jgi:hypothetical protein
MPIVSVGQKLPSVYLDRFQPVEGLMYRISVLSTDAIATEFHFIDIPSRNVKGSYQCIKGACCEAFGRRSQTYNVPIYVYQNPTQSTEGEIQVWRMTAPQWKKFSDMAQTVDFTVYDIMLVAQKRGFGMDLTYSAVPDVRLRDYWSAEQKEQIPQAVASFFQLGEASLVDPMSFNDWNQLLYNCGFDLQNMQWPGGQPPMSQGNARGSMGFSAPQLPVAPALGVLPPVPATAEAPRRSYSLTPQGGVSSPAAPVLQPPPPVFTSLPKPETAPQPIQFPVPGQSLGTSSPAPPPGFEKIPVGGVGAGAQLVTPAPVIPQSAVAPAVGVPLGTAPVIPQPTVPVEVASAAQPPDGNMIPGQVEISMEEMDQLLS